MRPQVLRSKPRAFDERPQLGPHDRRVDALHERPLREAAIGSGHEIVAADELRQPDQAFGHEFRVFDDIGRVRDDAGNEHAAFRELHPLPYPPFVLVTRIGHFQKVAADLHLQDEVDDVLERDIEGMRPVPATPAHVIAGALLRQSPERVVERLDAERRPFAVVLRVSSAAP